MGDVIIGEILECIPTVFRLEWPPDIKKLYKEDKLTNSDLEMVGLLQLWLVMQTVYTILRAAYVALFSNNSHMVGWVWRLAAKGSPVVMQLLQALERRGAHYPSHHYTLRAIRTKWLVFCSACLAAILHGFAKMTLTSYIHIMSNFSSHQSDPGWSSSLATPPL